MMAEKGQKFQWTKGEKQGTIEIFEKQDGKFLEFQSGRRCNSDLIGEFVIEIKDDSEILQFEDPVSKPAKKDKMPYKAGKTVESTPIKKIDNPLIPLIEKSKKSKKKLNLRIDLELPSKEFLNVMEENFDDNIIEVLSEHCVNNIEDPKKALLKLIKGSISEWYKYNNKTTKK